MQGRAEGCFAKIYVLNYNVIRSGPICRRWSTGGRRTARRKALHPIQLPGEEGFSNGLDRIALGYPRDFQSDIFLTRVL